MRISRIEPGQECQMPTCGGNRGTTVEAGGLMILDQDDTPRWFVSDFELADFGYKRMDSETR